MSKNKKAGKKIGRFFIYIFVGILLFLSIAYFVLAFLSQDKSLPRLTLYGKNVGNKTSEQLTSVINSIENANLNEPVTIVTLDGQKITKTFQELGIRPNINSIKSSILSYGRYKGFFPKPSYILATISNPVEVDHSISWAGLSTYPLNEIFKSSKVEPVNASFKIINDKLEIDEGKNGSEINTVLLSREIANSFVNDSSAELKASTKETKRNVTKDELGKYENIVRQFIEKPFKLSSDSKTVYPSKSELLGWIDMEMVVLEQKVSASDNGLTSYINDVLAKKINATSKNRVVSTQDNSVISEGRQGVQIDVEKTKTNIKNAVGDGQSSATIATSVSEAKEEKVGPGYTLGKYEGKYIEVNLTGQMLYIIEGSNLVGQFRVSTGKWSMQTPQGEYSINNKNARAYSNKYKLYMPYWMAFIGSEYGIHELPEWPDGTKEGESHLGTPVSHGCVRLGRGSAEQVYNWTDIGTPVYIHK